MNQPILNPQKKVFNSRDKSNMRLNVILVPFMIGTPFLLKYLPTDKVVLGVVVDLKLGSINDDLEAKHAEPQTNTQSFLGSRQARYSSQIHSWSKPEDANQVQLISRNNP